MRLSSSILLVASILVVLLLHLPVATRAHSQDGGGEEGSWEPVSFTRDLERERRRIELHQVGSCWEHEVTPCLKQCSERRRLMSERFNSSLLYGRMHSIDTLALQMFEMDLEVCGSYCQADVAWHCSQDNYAQGGTHTFKFGGRWPFHRWWMYAEPLSAIFSMLSVIMHLWSFVTYRQARRNFATQFHAWQRAKLLTQTADADAATAAAGAPDSSSSSPSSSLSQHGELEPINVDEWYPFDGLRVLHLGVWMSAYLFSYSFHTVDIRLTEYLDYYGAVIASSFAVYTSIVRTLSLRVPARASASSLALVLAAPFVGYVLFHCHSLYRSFDYKFHNIACIALMTTQAVVWLSWCAIQLFAGRNQRAAWYMIKGQVCMIFFASFEIWDFPPVWGVLDAHACYHLFANVVFYLWTHYEVSDMEYRFRTYVSENENKLK